MGILLQNVTVQNPSGQTLAILQGLSGEIREGAITLLVGQTGAGKSTLLDVLVGLTPPDSGDVQVDGRPLWQGHKVHPDVQAEMGVVFQYPEHQLFARTVQGEFAYSLRPLKLGKEEVQARAEWAMRDVGLPLPLLAESPLTLSGGQKRRVALATTFATKPRWLFLDEPTAGLDPQTVTRLVAFLQAWREQQGGGIVIATHDLDALFPIADQVIVLDQGHAVAQLSPQELCENPEPLLRARVGLPSSAQLAFALADAGLDVPKAPVSPQEMALAILRQVQSKELGGRSGVASQGVVRDRVTTATTPKTTATATATPTATTASGMQKQMARLTLGGIPAQESKQGAAAKSLVHALDPRSKWVFLFLATIGIVIQSRVLALDVSTALVLLAVMFARVSWQELYGTVKPFLFFILFSVLLSGATFQHGLGFDFSHAWTTFMQVYKVLLVMILGLLLPQTTSQLRMKRGLEQALAPLQKWRLPVEAFSLATSLMLRFVPLIAREYQRFSRITRARGKSRAKAGTVQLRDVQVVIIPLLLSLLQAGEDVSLAMEARGYSRMGQKRTSSIILTFQQVDYVVMIFGLLVFFVLLALWWTT